MFTHTKAQLNNTRVCVRSVLTHGIVRVEDVGGGRVVQDQGLVEVSAQPAQVLDIAALMEHAGLPEQTGPKHPTLIQQVRHWVCILWGEEGGYRANEAGLQQPSGNSGVRLNPTATEGAGNRHSSISLALSVCECCSSF